MPDGYSSDPDDTMRNPFGSHSDGRHEPLWTCYQCGSNEWRLVVDTYRCQVCGSDEFYDQHRNTSEQSGSGGRWIFVPTPPSVQSGRHPKQKHGDPGDHESAGASEFAESETPTVDPSVDSNLQPLPLSRRQKKRLRAQQPMTSSSRTPLPMPSRRLSDDGSHGRNNNWRDQMLSGLNQAVAAKSDKNKDWTLQHGPTPGVKYRGGTPPSPPVWNYSRDDLRAFQKWTRKIEIWRIQIAAYLPPNEAAMLLYVSLRGEAEEELEWCDISKINHVNWIDFIVEALRQPLMTKSIYLKRRYLHEYEYVQRNPGETIRAFCNRYGRIERSLKSVQIDVSGMYDLESRGARLLDRMKLGLEQQRLILVASGQSLALEDIREAAQIQFPDHRPTPPVVFSREFDGGRQQEEGHPSKGNGKHGNKGTQPGKDKGKGKGLQRNNFVKKTYIAETQQEDEANAEPPPEEEEEDPGEELPPEPDESGEDAHLPDDEADENDDELSEAIRCLTVTARRLQGMTLGRKFSGASRSIAQRKAESHCAACGQRGHWQGDSICPHSATSSASPGKSSKGPGKGKASGISSKPDAKSSPSKKVLSVKHAGGQRSVTFENIHEDEQVVTPKEHFGTYFTSFMVQSPTVSLHQVLATSLSSFTEFLVLDTACQRTCCSTKWFEMWEKSVGEQFQLHARKTPNREPFEFGHGPMQYSNTHAYLPSSFETNQHSLCLIGTNIIDSTNDIPLLGSNRLLEKLGAVIDIPRGAVRIHSMQGVTDVPIANVNGHLAIQITKFPQHAHTFQSVWNRLSELSDHDDADVELIRPFELKASSNSTTTTLATGNASSTALASSMAPFLDPAVDGRADSGQGHGSSCPSSHSTSTVVGAPGSPADGRKGDPPQDRHVSMSASHIPEVGQQVRQLQQMCDVRQKVDLEQGKRCVGRTFQKGIASAAAFTVLLHSLNLSGSSLHPSLGDGPAEVYAAKISEGQSHPCLRQTQVIDSSQTPQGSSGGEHFGFRQLHGGPVRMGSGGQSEPQLKKGNQAWLLGQLRSTKKLYQKEMDVYESLPTHHDYVRAGSKADVVIIDLVEVFAGKARVSELAPRYGLSATQPFDLLYGIDLRTKEGAKLLKDTVQQLKPLLLLVAWPCGPWSLFNRNLNYSHRLDELYEIREADRPLVNLGVDLCKLQDAEGRFYLGENPLRSHIWTETRVTELRDLPNNIEVVCDAGAYGAETRDGFPIQKPHKWVTNSECIANNLTKTMTNEQKLYTKKVEGQETRRSGEYCDGLANAILSGLQREAARLNPQRFHQSAQALQVFYVKPVEDEDAWQSILDEAEKRFENTYKRPFDITEGDPLMTKIKQLVPLEHEDLASLAYPKQRFVDPVRVGIFFYGMPPDEEETFPSTKTEETGNKATGVTTDIYFDGGPPMSREMKSSIARLHCNLGHAPKQEIIRILAAAGKLDSKIIAALDALRCGSCIRMVIESRSPEHVLQVLQELWYRPFGLPISITVDADTAFLSTNQAWHVNMGIEYDIIPTEEAWRLGKVGKRNALMRTLAERLIDQNAIYTRQQLDEVLIATLHSMNSSTYQYGRSPFQAAFGRIPRPVGDILSDNKALVISPQAQQQHQALQPELLRAEAIAALAQFSASQAVKRAMLRKTRNQNDLNQLQPGQTVAFWRMSGKSRQHKRGSWNLARFLAFDPDKKSCWVQLGKTSMRVGTTQLRAAAGWENWTPSQSDMEMIRQAENNIAQGLWLNEEGEPPAEDDAINIDDDIFQFRPSKMQRTQAGEPFQQQPTDDQFQQLPDEAYSQQPHFDQASQQYIDTATNQPYDMATLPPQAKATSPATPQLPIEALQYSHDQSYQHNQLQQQYQTQQQYNQINYDQRQITIHSPTYRNYGPTAEFGPLPPTPRTRQRSHGRMGPYQHAAPSTPNLPQEGYQSTEQRPAEQPLVNQPAGPVISQVNTATTPEGLQSFTTKQHDTPTYIHNLFNIYDDNTADFKAKHWDGSPEIHNKHFHNQTAYQSYLVSNRRKLEMKGFEEPERPDWDVSDDDEELSLSNNRHLTRQEMKQLDRELPWREIMKMPASVFDLFVQSAIKEFNGWQKWTGIVPLSDEEAQAIFDDPQMRKRIIKSRGAYKDKSRGLGPVQAKTRVVLIGCNDPDFRRLSRDSPTPGRVAEYVILSIAAAGANHLFNQDGKKWCLWLSDAAQAFLQGRQDSTERSGPLFMTGPDDPIQKEAGCFPARLYRIEGNCYGLPNAPRVWFLHVQSRLLEINFIQHEYDRCMFYHIGDDEMLDAVLIVHVDDFMMTYASTFNIDKMEKLFEWGSVTKIDPDHPGEYRGKEIRMEKSGDKFIYKVTQKKFLDNLQEGKIRPGRLQQDPLLTSEEWKEMRSVCGCIQWLSGQTRPDLSAAASLSHRGSETEIHDLKRLHETLRYAMSTADSGLTFPAVTFDKASVIATFADSGWANAAKFSSQFGIMIILCPGQVKDVTTLGFLLDWKSGRSSRICRSTLAAEACAADEGNDRACFVNMFITELLYGKQGRPGSMRLNSVHVTDAKSLYDCLISENPTLSEKRATMNVRSVQQNLLPSQIHWVPTNLMIADGLTKYDTKLQNLLRLWCQSPKVQLRDDNSLTSKQRPVKNTVT
eukprot:Skav200228  [mRNA]  locus=scaffold2352:155227:163374:+ [translate_table: standard]